MASGLKNWPKWTLVPIPHNLIFSDFKQCVLNVLSYLDSASRRAYFNWRHARTTTTYCENSREIEFMTLLALHKEYQLVTVLPQIYSGVSRKKEYINGLILANSMWWWKHCENSRKKTNTLSCNYKPVSLLWWRNDSELLTVLVGCVALSLSDFAACLFCKLLSVHLLNIRNEQS